MATPALIKESNKSESNKKQSNKPAKSKRATKEHSKDKILRAAIEHFAENGLKNASVRAICNAAGVNHALVVYNFGSKEALYMEVLNWCMKKIGEPRIQALDKLEAAANGKPIPLKKLVDTYVRGFFDGYGEPNSPAAIYLRFYGHSQAEGGGTLTRMGIEMGHDFRERFLQAFAKTLPEYSRQELVYRLGSLIGMLSVWRAEDTMLDDHLESNEKQPIDADQLVETLVALGCSLFKTKPLEAKPKPG